MCDTVDTSEQLNTNTFGRSVLHKAHRKTVLQKAQEELYVMDNS